MTETQNPDARPQPYATAPAGGTAFGPISLVVGLVLVVLGLVQQVIIPFLPGLVADSGSTFEVVGVMLAVFSIVTGLIAIVGVITGILGIQPIRARGRLAAAAGLAVSAAHLAAVVVGFIAPVVVDAVY